MRSAADIHTEEDTAFEEILVNAGVDNTLIYKSLLPRAAQELGGPSGSDDSPGTCRPWCTVISVA